MSRLCPGNQATGGSGRFQKVFSFLSNFNPELIMEKSSRIYVAGHRGLVGSAILRRLAQEGYTNLLTASRDQLDLRDQFKAKLR
jgi:hypothetical protein